ncbi:GlcNAc-1-P transferase [Aphelenchoides bicaudatus]|nr:GlcNAc-1-P transferase [Aphelenchoides bicaudatus]
MTLTGVLELEIENTLALNVLFSILSFLAAYYYIKTFIPIFISRGLYGGDKCKLTENQVAEPLGCCSCCSLLDIHLCVHTVSFLSVDSRVSGLCCRRKVKILRTIENLLKLCFSVHLPYVRLLSLLAAIISICTAILLGFADDILDLRWRHKLLFPTLSSLPLLMVYYISDDKTAMLLPNFLQNVLNTTYIDLGPLFYVYMAMLVIFCTNAINIIAGINGIEVGQSLVVAVSITIFNLIQITRLDQSAVWYHCLSFCILGPFIGASLGLYLWNRYPARAFVGDTYCYWAGMTLAVVAIIGHFSKTLLLFLIPQVFNFLYSCPQLFHFVPCPRHRLPRLNKETGKLEMSMAEYEPDKISKLGRLFVWILRTFGLLHYREFEKDGKKWVEVNNMTILNLTLKYGGPVYEYELTNRLLLIQMVCSMIAFFCRFVLSGIFYDNVQ